MTTTWRPLAEGTGWRAAAIGCTAGPADRPFEERHGQSCIALVTRGTFRYRSALGTVDLAPGGAMLGNAGQAYECGHDHSWGDRCIAFHYDEPLLETVRSALPGVRGDRFDRPHLGPAQGLLPLVAEAEAEALGSAPDPARIEELALLLAGTVIAATSQRVDRPAGATARDRRRVAAALRRLESDYAEPIGLADLAAAAATSPFHFLRSFTATVGMTPYQYLLRTRLQHAAVALRLTDDGVAAIAFDTGFGDLSTFNNRFRRLLGMTPTAWRRSRAGPALRSRPAASP